MARQRVTVQRSFPEYVEGELSLTGREKRFRQTLRQLDLEEAELRKEFDGVIDTASGPLPHDWHARWSSLSERRQQITRSTTSVERSQAVQDFWREAGAQRITPTMVLAPGQRALVQAQENDGQFIQGPRYPVNFTPMREASPSPPRESFHFADPDFIGRNDITYQSEANRTEQERESLLVNRWGSPSPGFGSNPPRGIRIDSVTLDEAIDQGAQEALHAIVPPTPITLSQVNEALRNGAAALRDGAAARREANSRHWETLLQGDFALTNAVELGSVRELRSTEQQRQLNEQLYAALVEGPPAERTAADAIADYTRSIIREEGMLRRILPPRLIPEFEDVSAPNEPESNISFHAYETVGVTIGNARALANVDFGETPHTVPYGGEDALREAVKKAVSPEPRRVKRRTVIVERSDEL